MPDRAGARLQPLLTGVGFLALLAGWLMATPLTGGLDEPSHYYKALGAASGQWSPSGRVAPVPGRTEHDRVLATLTGTFRLPPAYALQHGGPGQGLECVSSAESAACQDEPPPPPAQGPVPLPGTWDGPAPLSPPPDSGVFGSYVAPYPPFAYLPAGLAARLGADGPQALQLARIAGAVLCAVLLFGAARCSRPGPALVGLLVAVTPMTPFLGATVNTSGLEITGAVCTGAAVLALARGNPRREVWAWLAFGGVVLATSRVFGPVWVGGYGVLLAVLLGRRRLVRLVNGHRGAAAAAGGAVGAAVLACLAWLRFRTPTLGGDPAVMRSLVRPALGDLPWLLDQAIGRFGWTTVGMAPEHYTLGRWILGGLLVLALWAGTWRHRLALVGALAATVGATVAVEVVTQAPFGYASQARYTMAVAVAVPLLCGHVLAERADRIPRWGLVPALAAAAVGAAVLHVGGWYAAARQSAVGLEGPRNFLSDTALGPVWAPPYGWFPWLRLVVAGAVLLALAGLWAAGTLVTPARARPTAPRGPSPGGRGPGTSDTPAGPLGASAPRRGAAAIPPVPSAGRPSPGGAPAS